MKTVKISDDIYRRIKTYAEKRKLPIQKVIDSLLQKALDSLTPDTVDTLGLRGKFTDKELFYLIDIVNGLLVTEFEKANADVVLIAEIKDADRYERAGIKWGINAENLAQKVKSLGKESARNLLLWAVKFWGQNGPKVSLEEYVKELL